MAVRLKNSRIMPVSNSRTPDRWRRAGAPMVGILGSYFLACAEDRGYRGGREWLVSHYLFQEP